MMKGESTQFSIEIETKNRLDRLKAIKKEEILKMYGKKKRFVTNTMVINYVLDKGRF